MELVNGEGVFWGYVFTGRAAKRTPFGDPIFLCLKKDGGERQTKGLRSRPLETGFLYGGSEGRRADFATYSPKCNLRDLGPSRRRKLHILRFAFRGKSSVIPLLLLSPPNPLRWALAGPPFCTASTDSIVLLQLQWVHNTH